MLDPFLKAFFQRVLGPVAFSSRNFTLARELVSEGQRLSKEAAFLHSEAAKTIFKSKNEGKDVFTIDLHGLHAGEAVAFLGERLETLKQTQLRGRQKLNVVVGSGSHSEGGRQVLLEAVSQYLNDANISFEQTRKHTLVVSFLCSS